MSKKFFVIVLALIFLGCKENAPPEPPPYVRSIALEALDASCTEVWLKITLTHPKDPLDTTTDSILLTRDGQSVQTLRLTTLDSILIDEGLLPNRTYSYKAYRFAGTTVTDSSEAVTVTTMDTTSHNFTWQIDTLGDGGSSVLYDVAILNDTLAYAVGEIYKRDSLGNWDPLPYNLVKWNGQQWELKRVRVVFRGNLITPPVYGIYAFSPTDIWLAAGMAIHGNGTNWVGHDVRAITGYDTLSFTKCWGQSSSDMWFVGLRGSLAHYDGVGWRRVESPEGAGGMSVDLLDVWGSPDGSEVWTCGYNSDNLRSVFLQYNNGVWQTLWFREGTTPVAPFDFRVTSLWYKKHLYVCNSSRVFKIRNGEARQISPSFAWLIRRMRGHNENDIVVVTEESAIWHFNGSTWKKVYSNPQQLLTSIVMTERQVVAVGRDYSTFPSKAVVVVGKQ